MFSCPILSCNYNVIAAFTAVVSCFFDFECARVSNQVQDLDAGLIDYSKLFRAQLQSRTISLRVVFGLRDLWSRIVNESVFRARALLGQKLLSCTIDLSELIDKLMVATQRPAYSALLLPEVQLTSCSEVPDYTEAVTTGGVASLKRFLLVEGKCSWEAFDLVSGEHCR